MQTHLSRRRALVASAALCVSAAFAAAPALAQGHAQAKNRLLLQVSDQDPGKWGLALNNAYNVQNDLGAENVEVEIVVYGPGIGMLKADSPVAARVSSAVKSGIRVVACENTMHGHKLTKAQMNPSIGYVPAGVTELMKKQQEGWAYVRP